jgi:DNA-binding NarL/FixJ family response regulator
MSIRVLLADDHTIVREGLRLLLEGQGDISVVAEAADGREALRQTLRLDPDVVIMDIAMPELNGIEATRQIRHERPSVRVVILSMHVTTEYIYRALDAGALGYVLKESAGAELVTAVRAVYAGERYLCTKISEQVVDDYLRLRQAGESADPLDRLSSREREILQLVAEGKSSAEVAGVLCLSPKTVETYRSRLMAKLGVTELAGLVKLALQRGLISVL